ncbi:MAG: Flp pilus assembly protein CpaB, partial [Achromobacter sp.]|nr:Flp pilus assembly protein CpaB [Achromobacter sp.]
RLDESHLQRRQFPAAWAPRASLDPLAAQTLLGAVLSADINAGEIILPAHLLGQPAGQASTAPAAQLALPAGMRALHVTVADLGPLAGRLRVGDSVDVYASFARDGARKAVPVLQAARVLTVGAPADDGVPDTANAMLAVSPEDALRFVAARQGGILTAMLRHRDDAVAVHDEGPADLAALQGTPAEPAPAADVVILYGDRLGGTAPRGAGDGYGVGADGGAAWR